MAQSKAHKVGVAFDFQLVDDVIPTQPHDVPVDVVITDVRVIRNRR